MIALSSLYIERCIRSIDKKNILFVVSTITSVARPRTVDATSALAFPNSAGP